MDFAALAAYKPDAQAQRPYVQFEMRAMEDRTQTRSDGTATMVDKAWAIVRAPGAKDSLEKLADEWLSQLRVYAKDGRVPSEWPHQYTAAFEAWKKGEELPPEGTPIKTWPPLSPAQRKNILTAGILTVEDLAVANDEVRGLIGMGGHAMQQMAAKWLGEAQNHGSTAVELKNAMILLEEMKATITNQAQAIKELQLKKAA